MKANGIPRPQIITPQSANMTHCNFANNYVGFFGCELKTCDTIEEGIRSFDKKKKVKKDATESNN